MSSADFDRLGYAMVESLLSARECDEVSAKLANTSQTGTRKLLGQAWCTDLADKLGRHPDLRAYVEADYLAVQCTYFEKSAEHNWLVPIHQDLSIPVAGRVAHPALRGWSEKEGTLFVQPPVEVLEKLVAVRLHLDACGEADGPLHLLPGTHAQGLVTAEAAVQARKTLPAVASIAHRGSACVMRPLLLHASSRSCGSSRRRVLHFVFAPPTLPFGLRWPARAG